MVLPNRYLWPIGRHYPDFKLKGEDEFFKYETFCFNGCRRGGRLKCMNYGGFVNVDGLVSVDFDGDRFHDVVYGNFAVLTECKVAGVDYNNGRPQDGISLQRMPILGTAAFMRKIYRILAEVNRVPENEIGRRAFSRRWSMKTSGPGLKPTMASGFFPVLRSSAMRPVLQWALLLR